ncbi:MAG: glycosyltransferase family 2 protein [bacterium]
MRKLQVLMPMAGLGSRFSNAGYSSPKPLIQVDGRPMFIKALSSIDNIDIAKKFYFVIRKQHVEELNLDKLIKEALPDANIIVIPQMTRGATETALAASASLQPDDGLLIMDCDIWFESLEYAKLISGALRGENSLNGGLLTFAAKDPRYSYAKLDKDGIVLETAEKKVISNHAITGAYFFTNASEFIDSANKLLMQPINDKMPEYYLSLLYNILIHDGKRIQAAEVNDFASFGTPEELRAYKSTA